MAARTRRASTQCGIRRCSTRTPANGARRSAVSDAAEIVADLVAGGARVICFMKARKGVEMISRMVRDHLQDTAPLLADKVMPYRAGYTPEQRREIEQQLTRGELRAVIATNALELGIDIGTLDACVVHHAPTVAGAGGAAQRSLPRAGAEPIAATHRPGSAPTPSPVDTPRRGRCSRRGGGGGAPGWRCRGRAVGAR